MKKAMQRMLSLVLAAVLSLSLACPAFAAGGAQPVTLPDQDWQGAVTFPDWKGYVDDTLAMNSLYSFTCFRDQGELYVTPAEGVTSFRLFVNNAEVDTSGMGAGRTWKVDISGLTVDGTNTIQVSAITPSTLTVAVNIPYPTLISGTPEDVGMDADTLSLIGDLVRAEVKYGFSGAQLAVVKDGKLVVNEAWGAVNGYRNDNSRIQPGDSDYVPVTTDTLYDLASNTKMYSVNYALQYMLSHEGYDIALDDPITKFFPEFDDQGKTIFKAGTGAAEQAQICAWKSQLTIRDVLMHQAGFDPDPQYHNDQFDQSAQTPQAGVDNPLFSQDRSATLGKVLASPLTYEPGTQTKYSDVDYMLLCFIIEKVAGKGLDQFLKETFWTPMGLKHITYNPLENGFAKDDCAATELQGNTRDGAIHFANVRTDVVQGEVHDEKAFYAMDGVSGHAGLFSNAEDLAKLASLMLTGGYGGHQYFSTDIIDEFTKPKSIEAPTWGLGWWRQGNAGRNNYFTTHSSSGTIGHQGWTGTLTVIDPEQDLVVVLLTNKKNSPVLDNTVSANDFYSDNMVLGGLGCVVGYVYESLTSSPEAMDASLMQLAMDRISMLPEHKGAYDEAPHMNDAFALTDLSVTRAEKRLNQAAKGYAQSALDALAEAAAAYVDKDENKANAEKWLAELQARLDAVTAAGDAAPSAGLKAVSVSSMPCADKDGKYTGGDQNAVYFPRAYGTGTSYCYQNGVTWFDTYKGQGTIYFAVRSAIPSLQVFVNGVAVDVSAMLEKTGFFAVDVSKVAVNGRNSVQVSGMPVSTPRGEDAPLLMVSVNPEVIKGKPADVGLDSKVLNLISDIIQGDVDRGFTSAQLAIVKDGRMVYSNAWGAANSYTSDGERILPSDSGYVPATTDTLYDLASNSKMYAVNYALQYLVKEGQLHLGDPITKYFPSFAEKGNIAFKTGTAEADKDKITAWKHQLTIQDILQHQAGFDPDPQFHNDQFNQDTQTPEAGTANPLYAIGSGKVAEAICKAPLNYEPGTKTVYSDVDYMLLGLIIEKVSGKDLDTFLKDVFFKPLGLSHITYAPLEHGFDAGDCAATELNGNSRDSAIHFTGIREGVIQGTVHDEKAYYAMNGVSGHAGLFSNAEDLAKLAQVMLNHSGYGTTALFNPNVNSYFTARKDTLANWGQGWWRQGSCLRPWYFGVQASRDTIGHQGWTGTLTMIDPEQDLVVVYLTNKINSPVTDNTANPNQFDGNWYTASTLGFVANILYQGLSSNSAASDIQPALDSLLGSMAIDHLRLVDEAETADAEHPIVQSAYAVAEQVLAVAKERGNAENLQAAQAVVDALDPVRDAQFLAGQDAAPVPAAALPFNDVAADAAYYGDLLAVYQAGLMRGVTAEQFVPETSVTWSMLANILYQLEGRPETESAGSRWFSKAVAWADANGLLPGYEDGVTDPTAGLTGDEAAAILAGYAEKQGITLEEGALPGGDGTVSRADLTSVLAHFVGSAA